MPEASKSRFELIVDLIKATAWPALTIVVLIALFGPLRDTAKEIPTLLSRLSGMKAGPVEFQFNEQLQRQGFTEKQLAALRNLTADDIDIFLLVSFTDDPNFRYKTGIQPALFRSRILRLQGAGLLSVKNPENDGTNLMHDLTPLGRRLRGLLVNSTVGLLREKGDKSNQ